MTGGHGSATLGEPIPEEVIQILTNEQFGERVGVHFTMASRLRNGMRLPSVGTLRRIVKEFDLDVNEALGAHGKGSAEFGRYLRKRVFEREPEAVLDS